MKYAACRVPAAPVRKKAMHQGEMVNQVLFGETMLVLKEKKKWAKIRTMNDEYVGWITLNQLEEIDEQTAASSTELVTADLLNTIQIGEQIMNIPVASSLLGFDGSHGKFGKIGYQFSGNKLKRKEMVLNAETITKLSMQWLNVPYLWGGRTPLGVDCSGFVQNNFKMMGIDLPRDAWQQAQEGKRVKKLSEAIAGDLAFFDDKEEIVHVGILLSSNKIIHSSGRVRIDTIDKTGITNSDTGKRTHRLKVIRRHS